MPWLKSCQICDESESESNMFIQIYSSEIIEIEHFGNFPYFHFSYICVSAYILKEFVYLFAYWKNFCFCLYIDKESYYVGSFRVDTFVFCLD